jgi:hypothetical protein
MTLLGCVPQEGPVNISVIDKKTNTAIGDPLIMFDNYADEALAEFPANNTNFNVTIPTALGAACATVGVWVSRVSSSRCDRPKS